MKEMFENLMQVDHPNIVKFHKYWLDIGDNHARVTHAHTYNVSIVVTMENNYIISFLFKYFNSLIWKQSLFLLWLVHLLTNFHFYG